MFHVPVIARLCGDRVRYVWLVRHPLDVVCSIKELFDTMGVYPFEFHEYVRRFPAPLEAFAHAWVDTNRDAQTLAKTRPDNVVTLRYEDLLDDAPRELARILGFLGLDGDPAALLEAALATSGEVGLGDWKTYEKRTLTRESVGRWKELPDAGIVPAGRDRRSACHGARIHGSARPGGAHSRRGPAEVPARADGCAPEGRT